MRVAVVGHVEWIDFVRVGRVPEPGDIVHATEAWEEPGGGGAVAAVQLAKLAGGSTLYTSLGDDEIGHRAFAELTALGVRVQATFRPTMSRRAITHVDAAGERTITVLGDRLAPFGDDPLPWHLLEGADAVYFTAGDAAALRAARAARVLVATSRALDVLAQAAVPLDAIVGSAADPSERYADELSPPPGLVVRTEGAAGGTFEVAGCAERFAPAPLPGPIADAYGCGDSFAAALTFALGEGLAPADAVAVAARCGAAVLTGRGPYAGQLTSVALG